MFLPAFHLKNQTSCSLNTRAHPTTFVEDQTETSIYHTPIPTEDRELRFVFCIIQIQKRLGVKEEVIIRRADKSSHYR